MLSCVGVAAMTLLSLSAVRPASAGAAQYMGSFKDTEVLDDSATDASGEDQDQDQDQETWEHLKEQGASTSTMTWYAKAQHSKFPEVVSRHATGANFAKKVHDLSEEQFLAVHFYKAAGCQQCRVNAIMFEQVAIAAQRGEQKLKTLLVDCSIDRDLCQRFNVEKFPTVIAGFKSQFVLMDPDKVKSWKDSAKAEEMVDFLSSASEGKVNVDLDLAKQSEVSRVMQQRANQVAFEAMPSEVPKAASYWDARVALALWLQQAHVQGFMALSKHGELLNEFVGLLAARPGSISSDSDSATCQQSLQDFQQKLEKGTFGSDDDLAQGRTWTKFETEWKLCGTEWDTFANGFSTCRAGWPGKRGWLCGLWSMAHRVAATSTDMSAEEDRAIMVDAIKKMVHCKDCVKHLKEVPMEPLRGRDENILWWWRAHNEVNRLVAQEEAEKNDVDPDFPKVQWPSEKDCPMCKRQKAQHIRQGRCPPAAGAACKEGWDIGEVLKYLKGYYTIPAMEIHHEKDL